MRLTYMRQVHELVDCSDLPFSNVLWSDETPRSVSSVVSKGSKIFGSFTERNFSEETHLCDMKTGK